MGDIGAMASSLKTLLLLSHPRESQRQVVKTLKQSQKEVFKARTRVPPKTAMLVRKMGCREAGQPDAGFLALEKPQMGHHTSWDFMRNSKPEATDGLTPQF